MIKLQHALMAGALFVLTAVPVQAATQVAGSLAVNPAGNITVNNAAKDLSLPGVVVSSSDSIVNTPGDAQGYFAGVSLGSLWGATVLDTSDFTTFQLSNAAFGTFNALSGVIGPGSNASFLNVYLLGTFTPTQAGFDPSPASVQVTYTSDGQIVNGGFVLKAPPAPVVPEPASIAMAGIGLAAAGLVRGLRKRSV